MNYNEANKHPRDSRIDFNPEAHIYTAYSENGAATICDSVTTIVEDLFEKFDADYWAVRKSTPSRTPEMIKAEWEEAGRKARDLGTELHDRIEHYYLGCEPSSGALADKAFRNFISFARSHSLTPFRSEWRIFSEKYRVAGTLDFLVCNGGRSEIYDWKRSSKLIDDQGKVIDSNPYGKTAYHPIGHIPDTTFHHYALQVSLYRYLLETEYGITAEAAHLGTFHPAYDRPYIIDLPYLREEVIAILESRL